MPNKQNFNELGNQVACIDCDLRTFVWDLSEEDQRKHMLTHKVMAITNTTTAIPSSRLMERVCRNCDTPFVQERRRGRPYLECEACR